jgi:signal peptidase I
MMKRIKQYAKDFWFGWGRPCLVILIVLFSFRSAVADWNDVPTGSMRPTILEGDRIFVNKLAYDLKIPFTQVRLMTWGDPQRGDVVVLYSPADETRLVKRVIGVPGDTLELRGNRLWVNGKPAAYEAPDDEWVRHIEEESRTKHLFAREVIDDDAHPVMWTPGVVAPRNLRPLVVPPDHYFVMGDNRDQSRDSRSFGFVSRRRIVGRSSLVVLSMNPDRYYVPRWNRFFHELP